MPQTLQATPCVKNGGRERLRTFNYQHDADGNTTVRTRISNAYATDYRTTFTWDYRNRLTDVDYYDNNGVLTKHMHYVYGVFDHLLATEDDSTGSGQYGTIQHYVLDVSPEIPSAGVPGTMLAQPLLQFDGSQTLTVRFLVGLDPTGNQAVEAQETVPSLRLGDFCFPHSKSGSSGCCVPIRISLVGQRFTPWIF